MTILKLAFLGSTLLFSGAAVAAYGHVGDSASYAAPEGNGHVDIA